MNAPLGERLLTLFVTTARGLEPALAGELKALGLSSVAPARAGVGCKGTLQQAYRLCLWTRTANRVLLKVAECNARDADALYTSIKALPWEAHLAPEGTLAVEFNASRSTITHTHYGALKVKDAIVDRFRERTGVRPSVDVVRPDLRVNVHVRGERALVSIDLSGDSLHRRGYRLEGAMAPLKETLAAGILLYAGWPAIAAEGRGLLDPMCGSGTLPLEAALIAGDVAPGLQRTYFGFFGWLGHDADVWGALIDEALERRERGLANLPPIHGFDQSAEAIAVARENARRADLADQVVFETRAIESAAPPGTPGLIVANPPYGERLGQDDELPALYRQLGEVVRSRFDGWDFALFTGNPPLAGGIGLKAASTQELFNGRIECRLFHYRVTAGSAAAPRFAEAGRRERVIRPAATTDSEGARQLANRLRKNLRHLGRWARRNGVDCYRLYDADLPDYAVAIDLYRDVEEVLSVHVQEYEAPSTVDPHKADQRLGEALAVVAEVLELAQSRIHLKVRKRQKGTDQYEKLGRRGNFHVVQENGRRFQVNFTDYLDTGLFLDHRTTRQMLAELAERTDFLNLFCYTGSATVYAATGGAHTTTSVDLSKTYLEWAERNLALNGISGPEHRFIQADVMDWLVREARRPTGRYGLIFLDPPTFSNSKRMEGVFDVQRDHVALLSRAARLLDEEGALIFSTNFRRFRLDEAALPGLVIDEISAATLPEDFSRNRRIHRCWLIRRATGERSA